MKVYKPVSQAHWTISSVALNSLFNPTLLKYSIPQFASLDLCNNVVVCSLRNRSSFSSEGCEDRPTQPLRSALSLASVSKVNEVTLHAGSILSQTASDFVSLHILCETNSRPPSPREGNGPQIFRKCDENTWASFFSLLSRSLWDTRFPKPPLGACSWVGSNGLDLRQLPFPIFPCCTFFLFSDVIYCMLRKKETEGYNEKREIALFRILLSPSSSPLLELFALGSYSWYNETHLITAVFF